MEVDVVPGAISSQSNTSPTAPKVLALRAFTNELPAREPPIQRVFFFPPLGTIIKIVVSSDLRKKAELIVQFGTGSPANQLAMKTSS